MEKKSLDLSQFIPQTDKNQLSVGLFTNIINNHFTNDTSLEDVYGWFGEDVVDGTPYISIDNIDNKLNILEPCLTYTHGSETHVHVFTDFLKKLQTTGYDIKNLKSHTTTEKFSFVLPINYDKFCNYSEYYWYGSLSGLTSTYNPNFVLPEYITIAVGAINDWSQSNFWVHKNDIPNNLYISNMTRATRPIIEYDNTLSLNSYYVNNIPAVSTTLGAINYTQKKISRNQYPLFDMFTLDGNFTFKTSSIFTYHNDGVNVEYDDVLEFYVTKSSSVFMFKHHLSNDDVLYAYKTNNTYSNIWKQCATPNALEYFVNNNNVLQNIDPLTDTNSTGWYKFPNDFSNNAEHVSENVIDFTNIQQHFADVMKNQIGFIGNVYGTNNYRSLTLDKTLGGIILDSNSDWTTVLPVVLSNDYYSIPSIIDFMRNSYMQLLSNATQYVVDNFTDILSTTEEIPQNYGGSFFTTYLFNLVKEDLSKSIFSNIFFDTTSGLNFSSITLPYLRVLNTSSPGIKFDDLLNSFAIQHHDGHLSKITTIDSQIINKIVLKSVKRSDNNFVGGMIGPIAPKRPYKKQLWLNTLDNKLYIYDIVSDVYPFDATISTNATTKYYYDRANTTLYSLVGNTFVPLVDDNIAWVECDIGLIIDDLILSIEKSLYDGVSTNASTLKLDFNVEFSNSSVQFSNILQNEFLQYCETNNITNPYPNDYLQTDPFTWNYSNASLIPGLTNSHATWQSMYIEYFGTSRPDLFPWILQGYTSKPLWWDTHYSTLSHTVLWNDIVNDTGPNTAPNGPWTKKLSVNTSTSQLLPPYVRSGDPYASNALYNIIPLLPYKSLVYGDLGDIEVVWRKSIHFAYSLLKASYICNPVKVIKALMSNNNTRIDGYFYDSRISAKNSFTTNSFFGDVVERKNFSKIVISSHTQNIKTYKLQCVAITENGNVFRIEGDNLNLYFTNSYSDAYISLNVLNMSSCFYVGDVILIDMLGNISYNYIDKFYTNNLLQVFTNFSRSEKYDFNTNEFGVMYKSADIKLCHRNSSLYNTQNLEISTDYNIIPQKSYDVILKKNKNIKTYTLDTLRVILQKLGGNQTLNGTRIPIGLAEDWEYRIVKIGGLDKNIKVFNFDTNGVYSDYQYKNLSFKKYLDKTNIVDVTLPLNIKGLQNVVNFLNGYVEYIKTTGWEINSSDHMSNADEFSGGFVDWDTEIFRVISAQYANIISGTGVLFNAFRNNVWFKNTRGVVSSFLPTTKNKNIQSAIYDIRGNVIDISLINIFRFNDKCQINSQNVPMTSIVLSVDEYEHVIVFDEYIGSTSRYNLIYDKKYGTVVKRVKFITQRSLNNGKPILNGFYLDKNVYKKNIENSISTIEKLYDFDSYDNDDIFDRVQSLIGYKNRSYLQDLGYTNKTQFNFWRGTLKNKGTQASITSFNNSKDYGNDAKIFEYWAYKVASYGDARDKNIQDFFITNNMLVNNINIFSFTKDSSQVFLGDENKINENVLLKSKTITTIITIDNVSRLYDIPQSDEINVYKSGIELPLVVNVDYQQLNGTTIKFLNATTNDIFTVLSKVPNYDTHNILNLINNKSENSSYIKAFDPLRNVYNVDSLDRINIIDDNDPSICNSRIEKSIKNIKSFWSEEHVNTIWWDTSTLEYLQYSDKLIYPNRILRHNIWGKQSDYSNIKINQWIKSPVHPREYVTYTSSKQSILNGASGIPSTKILYKQKRNWFVKTIGWKYSENPQTTPTHTYLVEDFDNTIFFEKNVIGDKIDLYIDNLSWNDFDLKGGFYISPINTSNNIEGQVFIADSSNISNVAGSALSLTAPSLISSLLIELTKIEISNNAEIGEYILNYVDNGSSQYDIVCTCASTGNTEALPVIDVSNTVGSIIKYDFKTLGVKVFAKTLVDHTNVLFNTSDLRKQHIAETLGNINHDILVRSKTLCSYTSHITSAFVISGWVGYKTPTQEMLNIDNPYPYNKWQMVVGETRDILKNGFTYSDISNSLSFTTKNTFVQKYTYTLDDYILVDDTHIWKKYTGDINFYNDFFDITNVFNYESCEYFVYVNGIRLKHTKDYIIFNGVLRILPNVLISIGDMVHMIIKAYVPKDNMFDVSTLEPSDDYVFTFDYPHTILEDFINGVKTYTYYFFVYDVKKGDVNTVGIKEDISNRNKTFFSIDDIYKNSYTNLNLHNSYNLTKSHTFTKLGIMNDATLRDDPQGVNFKNKHSEWTLIHANMSKHISKTLWDKVTYSLAGYDRAGNIIPNVKYSDYDVKNKTQTRFGFDIDKTLLDKNVSLETLKSGIIALNDWSTLNFIDENDINASFDTPTNIINTMNKIYDITNYKIPNALFFVLLEDMISIGYHMTEIFKTSYIEIEYSQSV